MDVFVREKYTGNQLAVVDEASGLSPEATQRVAREMTYSETTFITDPEPTGEDVAVSVGGRVVPVSRGVLL